MPPLVYRFKFGLCIWEKMSNLPFQVWFVSLNIVISGCMFFVQMAWFSFSLWLNKNPSLFFYSLSIDWCFGYFGFVAIVNRISKSTRVLWYTYLESFNYMLPYGNFNFNFERTSLHWLPQWLYQFVLIPACRGLPLSTHSF